MEHSARCTASIVIVVLAMGLTSVARTQKRVEWTCPLDDTTFDCVIDASGFIAGQRLDLRPLGAVASPPRLPVCPRCGLVIHLDQYSEDQRELLRGLVNSDAYRKWTAKEAVYFRLAKIIETLGADQWTRGIAYLQASWEAEDQPQRCDRYRELALQSLLGVAEATSDKRMRCERQLPVVDLLRLLGRFDEARERLVGLADCAEPGKDRHILDAFDYEGMLIERRDREPRCAPGGGMEGCTADKELLRARCEAQPGYDVLQSDFSIDWSRTDTIFGGEVAIFVLVPLHDSLVDEVIWERGIVDGLPSPLWSVFRDDHRRLRPLVTRHAWLAAWRTAGPGRNVELVFHSKGARGFEAERLVAWRHAGLVGRPACHLILRGPEAFSRQIILLGENESRGLLVEARVMKSDHWLDQRHVNLCGSEAEYGIVSPAGELSWHAFSEEECAAARRSRTPTSLQPEESL